MAEELLLLEGLQLGGGYLRIPEREGVRRLRCGSVDSISQPLLKS
jgi:hypothetical protein